MGKPDLLKTGRPDASLEDNPVNWNILVAGGKEINKKGFH